MAKPTIGYRKKYSIRRAIKSKNSLEVTFPYEVVEKEARARGLSVDEFIEKFIAVAQYNAFDGVHYTFKSKDEEQSEKAA